MSAANAPDGLFYGWKIVAALFVMLTFSSGLGFYNHAVLLQALANEKGLAIATASSAVSIFFFATGISGMAIARLIERYDIRMIMGAGTLLASLTLALTGSVDNIPQLYILYVLFGIGFSASSLLPATTLLARWFHKSRARALSIASTGLSLGGIVVTPASAALVESQGIAVASPILGLAYLLGVLPLCLLVLRSWPEELGLAPEGSSVEYRAGTDLRGVTIEATRRDPYFWSLGLAYIFVMLAQVGGITHQYGIVSAHMPARDAAMTLAILPLFSIIGRLAGGALLDRLDARRFTLGMMFLQGVSLASMGLFPSPLGLALSLACFGISVGNLLMLQPLLLASRYGLLHYSRIYALANLLTTIGFAVGPVSMGYLYALSGSYGLAYGLAGCAGLTAFTVFLIGGRQPPLLPDR